MRRQSASMISGRSSPAVISLISIFSMSYPSSLVSSAGGLQSGGLQGGGGSEVGSDGALVLVVVVSFGVLRFFLGLSGDLVIVLVTVLVTVTVLSGPTTVDGFGGFCGALRISVVRVTVVVVVDTEVSVIVAGPADPVTSPSTSGTAKTRPTTRAPVANTPPPIAKARFALRRANLPWSACCRFTVPPWRASGH